MTTKSHYYFGFFFLLQYEIHFCTKLEQYAFFVRLRGTGF